MAQPEPIAHDPTAPDPAAHARHEPPTDDMQLLADDTRAELGRLVTHPIDEAKRLEKVADEGSSGATPFLVLLGVLAFVAVVAAVVITIAFVAGDGA